MTLIYIHGNMLLRESKHRVGEDVCAIEEETCKGLSQGQQDGARVKVLVT